MALLPRPVSPYSAFADLKLMFAPDRPHRWLLLALSMTLTGVILWAFYLDSLSPKPERKITYIQSWVSDRKDSEIIRKQKADLDIYEAALKTKQEEFQRLADKVGIEWREEAAKNSERRATIIAAIQKQLDEKLAKALEQEAAEEAGGLSGATSAMSR